MLIISFCWVRIEKMFIGDTSKKSCMETKDKRAEKKTVSLREQKGIHSEWMQKV